MQNTLKYYFNLRPDQDTAKDIAESIRQGCEFKGTNMWALVAAIAIASVGLNTNSTAVIIGAMLVSPLMGPIIGAGYALSTFDFELLKMAGRNFLTFVAISLATSTIYFAISPLEDPTDEILARTYPTIYDVMIAFFGGVAGIVAYTRKEKGGNIIPGVAIATALMPPLCTAGYGITRISILHPQELYIFAGSLYLFVINSVMIAFATMLVTRLVLRSRRREYGEESTKKRVTWIVGLIIAGTTLPSLWLAYTLVEKNDYDKRVQQFLNREVEALDIPILKTTASFSNKSLEIFTLGEPDSLTQTQVRQRATLYDLGNTTITFRSAREYIVEKEQLNRSTAEKQVLFWQDSTHALKQQLERIAQQKTREQGILRDLMALDTNITALGIVPMRYPHAAGDTIVTALIRCNAALSNEHQDQVQRVLNAKYEGRLVQVHYAVPPPALPPPAKRRK